MAKSKAKEKAVDSTIQPEVEEANEKQAAPTSGSENTEKDVGEAVADRDLEDTTVNVEGEGGIKNPTTDEKMDDVEEEQEDDDDEEEEADEEDQKQVPINNNKKVNAATKKAETTPKNASSKGKKRFGKKKAAMAEAVAEPKERAAGLIFLCNNMTKGDCFKYKVLGLPEGKKDVVAKVYKGMRLFLFDTDLKLLYGIYKAVAPGGYKLEEKAFSSAFPSQVRFATLHDCKPLPEEKFKAAIKSNYFRRTRFNCELSPDQVKNLCRLFQEENNKSNGKKRRFSPLRSGVPYKKTGAPSRYVERAPYRYDGYERRGAVQYAPVAPAYAPDRVVPDYGYNREVPADPYRREPLPEREPAYLNSNPAVYRDPPVVHHDPYLYREGPVMYRDGPSSAPAYYAREPAPTQPVSYAQPSYGAGAQGYYAHPGYR